MTSDGRDRSNSIFGFWVYLMTDCVLFASLFAAFVVLRSSTNGGPSGREIFGLPFVLSETLILLTSSFACGLAILAAQRSQKRQLLILLGITFALGASFLALELREFAHLASEGNNWRQSAFLSGFFTLVGTHGLHISVGLTWLAALTATIIKHGLNTTTIRRLTMFTLFWHFLDIIWIFIFTIVYLLGVIKP